MAFSAAPMAQDENHRRAEAGPPWILGHRGTPREAPENTLVSLRRALELGLDGVEYDLHACQGGEPVLIHDETLDRTTDRSGPVAELAMSELVHVDAGGWFARRFVGEPLPLLEEALELGAPERAVRHMIELKDPGLVPAVARALARLAQPLAVHIASFHRNVCLEARDLGLPTMLLTEEACEDDRRFVHDERLTAYGTAPGGWDSAAGDARWDCERWSWSVDDPADLLEACRRPLFGFNTNEPERALATRELVRLTPEDRGPFPLELPALEVAPALQPAPDSLPHGEWTGEWQVRIAVRNPLPCPVQAALALEPRGGAFQGEGWSATFGLDAGARREHSLTLVGGSWSPIEDPRVRLRLAWREGRRARELLLDAPLQRVRTLYLAPGTQRLRMLCENPLDLEATMSIRRRGRELLAWVEDPGGSTDVAALVRLGHRVRRGRRGVRISLPGRIGPRGVPFAVGFEGTVPGTGERRLRRWGGGLPYGLSAGAPCRLMPMEQA
jgi:glycerophosphoryl diester phosphodiesterase